MSHISKKKLIIFLVIATALVAAYLLKDIVINKLPKERPQSFNFIINYGITSKNQIDTVKGTYTKDMIQAPSITVDLRLSEAEMNTIYNEMRKINILSYPEKFKPGLGIYSQTPYTTYSIKVIIDGKEHKIYWEDKYASKNKKAVELRELINEIQRIISSKDEYKKLPPAKGGYD